MAEEADKESKTEEATEKRLREAGEKGNVPLSREVPIFASILGILMIFGFLARQKVAGLVGELQFFIDDPGGIQLDRGSDAALLLQALALDAGRFLLPCVLVITASGLAASLFQNPPRLVVDRIRPQWSRLSPRSGFRRLFGSTGQTEFLKALFKFVTVSIVGLVLLRSEQNSVVNAMFSDPSMLPELILSMSMRFLSAVAVATVVLVVIDLVWARLRWRRDLRMTRQEVKDELKQMEGDPLVKARLRSLAKDRARRRMLSAVPRASVVIANPTHYAVALRYKREEGGAPVVLAKGKDLIALKIREAAEQHLIPVIEDKALARSLYESVDVDQMIPSEFYRAVAQIFYYLYSRDKTYDMGATYKSHTGLLPKADD